MHFIFNEFDTACTIVHTTPFPTEAADRLLSHRSAVVPACLMSARPPFLSSVSCLYFLFPRVSCDSRFSSKSLEPTFMISVPASR